MELLEYGFIVEISTMLYLLLIHKRMLINLEGKRLVVGAHGMLVINMVDFTKHMTKT